MKRKECQLKRRTFPSQIKTWKFSSNAATQRKSVRGEMYFFAHRLCIAGRRAARRRAARRRAVRRRAARRRAAGRRAAGCRAISTAMTGVV